MHANRSGLCATTQITQTTDPGPGRNVAQCYVKHGAQEPRNAIVTKLLQQLQQYSADNALVNKSGAQD